MKQLTGMDSMFLSAQRSPELPMNIGLVIIYDGASASPGAHPVDDLRAHLEARTDRIPVLKQRLVRVPFDLDHPYRLEDAEFDAGEHVHVEALPTPGGITELTNLALRFVNEPITNFNKPPWQYCIVEGLNTVPNVSSGSIALITKYHHALVDGASGAQLLTALHSSDEVLLEEGVLPAERMEEIPGAVSLVTSAAANAVRRSVTTVRVAGRLVQGFGQVFMRQRHDPEKSMPTWSRPITRFSSPVSAGRVLALWRCTLPEAKDVKRLAAGATINDVMLAVIGGAVRLYLEAKDQLPDQTVGALCPISLRSRGSQEAGGNQITMMMVPIGTDTAEPALRLANITNATKSAKNTVSTLGPQTFSDVCTLLPGVVAGPLLGVLRAIAGRVSLPFSGVAVSNVPGPREPLYAGGLRVADIFAVSFLIDGMGLVHAVSNYMEDIIISVNADATMLPDPEFYVECLDQSWKELGAAPSA